jgi:uncharacterized protein YjbI with pentapeptide repeats
VGTRWGDPISEERQTALRALADKQREWATKSETRGEGSYFQGVPLTGADVGWLAGVSVQGEHGDVPNLHLEGVRLDGTHLEGARLVGAHLEGAVLRFAHLEGAGLFLAHLEGADLVGAHLRGASLGARLEGADLQRADLEEADLGSAHLEGANLLWAHLKGARLDGAHLEGAALSFAHLEEAFLTEAHLEGADLSQAHLEGAVLHLAHLEGACLALAHLEGAALYKAHLHGKAVPVEDVRRLRRYQAPGVNPITEVLLPADLRGAFFSPATDLDAVTLGSREYGCVCVADVRWGGVNLAVVRALFPPLGDERAARYWRPELLTNLPDEPPTSAQRRTHDQEQATAHTRLYHDALRANRQLAVALQDQGLNELADRFTYRAKALQRQAFRRQRQIGRWLFSWLLASLAGYGYRLQRILIAYAIVLVVFTVAYATLGTSSFHHTTWYQPWVESLLVSFTAIHGRVFFEQFGLDNILSWVAGLESVIGLVIEGVFTAMLVQRFFAR